MNLHDAWKRLAFNQQGEPVKHVWDEYLSAERSVYEKILKTKRALIEGTVSGIAEELGFTPTQAAAFIDGVHECVDGLPPIEDLEDETKVKIEFDFARLYKQMVEYKAEALYSLPEWTNIFTAEEQKQLYTEQKKSHTVVRNEAKVGRNDPCPCGSGKKYKKCCGA